MTFSEATLNLPTCSYAVYSSVSLGDMVVEVWFLYPGRSATENGQDAGLRPLFRVEASYFRAGELVPGPSKQVCSAVVPKHIRQLDWKSSPVEHEEFPGGHEIDVILQVLSGVSLQDAKNTDLWPRELKGTMLYEAIDAGGTVPSSSSSSNLEPQNSCREVGPSD